MVKAAASICCAGCITLAPLAGAATPIKPDHPLEAPTIVEPEIAQAPVPATLAPVGDQGADLPKLSVGDRLSVKIYERPDLSGDIAVRSDGTIALPLIGSFVVAGRRLPEIEYEVGQALEKITGRVSSLSIDVAEWRPIFVVGAVEKPGPYPFKLYMTGLHALAAAGGPYRLSSTNRLEISREELSHRQNLDKLKTALARRERVVAELNNSPTIDVPKRLAELATENEAAAVLEAERRIMERRKATYEENVTGSERKIELAKKEIEVLKEQLSHEQDQVNLTRTEAADSRGLADKGLTPRTRLFEVQRLLANYEVAVREVMGSLTRAELTLSSAEKERTGLESDRRLKLEEEFKAAEEEIRSLEMAVRSSAETTGLSLSSGSGLEEPKLSYEIVRREGHLQETIDADENTELQPGDVVRIKAAR